MRLPAATALLCSVVLVAALTHQHAVWAQSFPGGGNTKKHFFDDVGAVKQHSFHAPLLEDYLESGLHSWSFGASGVVTDKYIRLTPATGKGHGYLWNHYASELKSFRAHFSITLDQRPHIGSLTGGESCQSCGVAMWAIKNAARSHTEEQPFYGVPANFEGLGVVISEDGKMYLVAKESESISATSAEDVSLGSCRIAISSSQVDVVLEINAQEERVVLSYAEPRQSSPTICVSSGSAPVMPERFYYGFTAYSTSASPMSYEVVGLMVIPIANATEGFSEESEEAAVEYDVDLDKQEREFWHEGRADEDPKANVKKGKASKDSGDNDVIDDLNVDADADAAGRDDDATASDHERRRPDHARRDDDADSALRRDEGRRDWAAEGERPERGLDGDGPDSGSRRHRRRRPRHPDDAENADGNRGDGRGPANKGSDDLMDDSQMENQ